MLSICPAVVLTEGAFMIFSLVLLFNSTFVSSSIIYNSLGTFFFFFLLDFVFYFF